MTPLFEPDPTLMAFFFAKKFLYLEILALLALVRVIVGHGIARWPALVTLILSAGGILTTFAPVLGWNQGALYVTSARYMAGSGGMAALLVPSTIFLICSITPRARWRVIDWFHLAMMAALIGLWWWTS